MRCPFCHGNFELQGPFCPLCGRRIIGSSRQDAGEQAEGQAPPPSGQAAPAVTPSLPTPPTSSGGVLVVELEPEGPRAAGPPRPAPTFVPQQAPRQPSGNGPHSEPAREPYVGRTCPYCRFPMKLKEDMTCCPACGVAHHTDCWGENGGCTTYACRYSPESHPPEAAGPPPGMPRGAIGNQPLPTPGGMGTLLPPGQASIAARLEAKATNALVLSLMGIFCFGILSLAGLAMSITVLVQMKALGIDVPTARMRATWAIVLGVGVPIVMAVVLSAMMHTVQNYGPPGMR